MSNGLLADFSLRRSNDFDAVVSLEALPGETVAILGPNGAGKSTVIGAISGVEAIDSGTIRLNDSLLDSPDTGVFIPPEDRHIGVVFQDGLLFPHLNVIDNVSFGLRSRGMAAAAASEIARSWIDRLGLAPGIGEERPSDLSGGQAQRVALARALATEPAMLLLDEPLSALDVTTRAQVRRELADHLEDFEGPKLLVTHDPSDAFLLADRIYVLEEGRITQMGTPDEIRLRPKTAFAADFAGANLLRGVVDSGEARVGETILHVADAAAAGKALLTIRPNAISVHDEQPQGSPRNSWRTTVESMEPYDERARLRVGDPLPLTVEITRSSAVSMGLAPGRSIWVAVKATEISVEVEQEPRRSDDDSSA